jgi:hypothetical protein
LGISSLSLSPSLWNLEAVKVSSVSIPQATGYLDPDLDVWVGVGSLGGEARSGMCWQLMTNDISWVCRTLRPLVSTTTDPAISPTRAYLYVQNLWPQNSKHGILGAQLCTNWEYTELTLLFVSPRPCEL